MKDFHRRNYRIIAVGGDRDTGDWPVPVAYVRIAGLSSAAGALFRTPRALWQLSRLLRTKRPALLLTFTIKPNIFCGLLSGNATPTHVATLTGLGYTFLTGSVRRRVVSLLYRLAFRRTAALVFHNADDAEYFRRHQLAQPRQIHIIPGSGVDTEHFVPQPLPGRGELLRLLFVGRLLKNKGIVELVDAVTSLHRQGYQLELHVVGTLYPDNPAALTPAEWAALSNSPAVVVHGYLRDIRPILYACHLFALPSHREGMPLSVLEAMAAGRPVLTTDVPGCRTAVSHGVSGWVVPAASRQHLKETIIAAIESPPYRLQQFGQAGRARAEQLFSKRVIVEKYARLVHYLRPFAPSPPAE